MKKTRTFVVFSVAFVLHVAMYAAIDCYLFRRWRKLYGLLFWVSCWGCAIFSRLFLCRQKRAVVSYMMLVCFGADYGKKPLVLANTAKRAAVFAKGGKTADMDTLMQPFPTCWQVNLNGLLSLLLLSPKAIKLIEWLPKYMPAKFGNVFRYRIENEAGAIVLRVKVEIKGKMYAAMVASMLEVGLAKNKTVQSAITDAGNAINVSICIDYGY